MEGKKRDITKEDIISLLDKGLQSSSDVKLFIYSKEFLDGDGFTPIFNEGKYKDLIDYVNLSEYKNPEFEFIVLKNTDDYVWGDFLDKNGMPNGKTTILIDKSNGQLKHLNNNILRVNVE